MCPKLSGRLTAPSRPAPRIEIRVRWAHDAANPRTSARRLAALLLEVPSRGPDLATVLQANAVLAAQHRLGEPISYLAVGTYIPHLPPIGTGNTPSSERPVKKPVRALPSRAMSTPAQQGVPAGRVGTGGRNRTPQLHTQTAATAELMELLPSPPEVRRLGPARMLVFMVDPEGDGVIVARLSNRDIQNGETALGQVHAALDAAKQLGLRPRLIVVSTGLSGGNRLSDRPDLELLEEEILGGRCRWVWFRGVDRISRRPQVFYTFVDLLETAGVALYLTEIPGRAVDWEKDEIQMSFNALMGSRERRAIYERTHGPLINRWLNEGRGWPGGLPFGFRRNKLTKYPEIDPVQWPFVRMAFEHYVQFEDGEGGGVRAVQEKLASEGCTISRETITRMIKRPIYFTGEWTTTRAGVTVENRPIEIPEDQRISLVWERVQDCRRLRRGKDKRTPPGLFALNRIGRLADGTRIRARLTTADPEEVIYYRPYVPEKGGSIPVRWRGWKVRRERCTEPSSMRF